MRLDVRTGTPSPPQAAGRDDSTHPEPPQACTGHRFARPVAGLYALYLPLSLVVPAFVQSWLLDDSIATIWLVGDWALVASALSFVVLVVIGPVLEEIVFRGILLRYWMGPRNRERWGLFWSSLAFAILHTDLIGSFLFGLVTGLAYLRTGKLRVAIGIHVANNLIAWAMAFFFELYSVQGIENVSDFQATWWVGAVAFAVALPFTLRQLRQLPRARS